MEWSTAWQCTLSLYSCSHLSRSVDSTNDRLTQLRQIGDEFVVYVEGLREVGWNAITSEVDHVVSTLSSYEPQVCESIHSLFIRVCPSLLLSVSIHFSSFHIEMTHMKEYYYYLYI